jgi:hypothetical protein
MKIVEFRVVLLDIGERPPIHILFFTGRDISAPALSTVENCIGNSQYSLFLI